MSSQNAYPGPNAQRPGARPVNPERPRQPSWVNPQAQIGATPPAPQPQQASGWPQQPGPDYQGGQVAASRGGQAGQGGGYAQPPQPGYGQAPRQPAAYGQWSDLQPSRPAPLGTYGGASAGSPAQQPDPYAPQFEPYVAPTRPTYSQSPQQPASGYGAQPSPQWPGRGADPRGFDVGSYAAPAYNAPAQPQPAPAAAAYAAERPYHEPELSASDWAGQPGAFGHESYQPDSYQQGQSAADLGFGQAEGGELEQAYSEDDDGEYETDDAPRRGRPVMIAAALISAILVGSGLAYSYKKFTSGGSQGDPPIIKSEAFPSKTKPADAGGKQFPYADSKIMGRLGDGSSSASADDQNGGGTASSDTSSGTSSGSASSEDGGPRKVATLVVGRDGTIQAPPQAPAAQPQMASDAGVPGTSLVDVFGSNSGSNSPSNSPSNSGRPLGGTSAVVPTSINSSPPVRPKSINADDAPTPAPPKKVTVAKINSASSSMASSSTGSIDERDDAVAPRKKKLKKLARAETTETDAVADSVPVTSSGGTGFVAVLASVPRSASSRIDALKRFADMQQKYGTALAGKTPDVADANLGAKGDYHRLIVGPPGSREQASTVCSQLKAQGYNDCWVTTY